MQNQLRAPAPNIPASTPSLSAPAPHPSASTPTTSAPARLLLSAALLFSSIISQAQAQQPQPQKPVKTGDEWKMPGDVLQRSRHFADSLKKNLDLDAATTQQIFQAYMNNTKPVDEINITTTDPTARKEKVKANHAAFNEKLKSILSPAQYQKYLQADASRPS